MKRFLMIVTIGLILGVWGSAYGQDSLNVTRLGEIGRPCNATDVAVQGNFAYMADGNLRIMDITNPSAPWQAGIYYTSGYPYAVDGVAVSGDYAYITDGWNLRVIDIMNPATPTEVGQYYDPIGGFTGVAVSGDYAYVTTSFTAWGGSSTLRILNISIPTAPVLVGTCTTPNSAMNVVISGNYAYVGTTYYGLRIIDISNPTAPFEVGFHDNQIGYPLFGSVYDVAISGNLAYVANEYSVVLLDIHDPASPTQLSFYPTNVNALGLAYGVAIHDTLAYVAAAGGLQGLLVFDIGDSLELIQTFGYSQGLAGAAFDVEISDDYLYLACSSDGLQVFEIADSANTQFIGFYNTSGYPTSAAVSGNYAYVLYSGGYPNVAFWTTVLRVINIENPATIWDVGAYTTPGLSYPQPGYGDLAVADTLVYLLDNHAGLRIINVAQPEEPIEIGILPTVNGNNSIVVVDSFAYVAGNGGMRIINVGVPSTPTQIGFYSTPNGSAYDVVVSANYAYVAAGSSLRVVDITNPVAPTEVGFCNTTTSCVAISGDYAFVGGLDFRVIDVTNPATPTEVGVCAMPIGSNEITVSGNYAYVAANGAGLRVVDISNPVAPTEVGFYITPGQGGYNGAARGVAVDGCRAYVANSLNFGIYDVSHFVPCSTGVPMAPDSLVIQYLPSTSQIQLSWAPVLLDTAGQPIDISRYTIYRSAIMNPGVWDSIGVPSPPETTVFVDTTSTTIQRFYHVRAVKD